MKQARTLSVLALVLSGIVLWWIVAAGPDTSRLAGPSSIAESTQNSDEKLNLPLARVEVLKANAYIPSQTTGSGLSYWQEKYRERLAGESVWIFENDDWWFDDLEVMAAFQAELDLRLAALAASMNAEDLQPKPWQFPGIDTASLAPDHPFGVVLSLESVDFEYLGHYEMTLVATELQHLSVARKSHGLTPFAAERPTLSLAEMNSSPFAYPIDYFLQAYSGDDGRVDWPAEIIESSRRAWSDFIAEYAFNEKDYLHREAAMSDAARALGILKPHPAHYDRLLPGTGEFAKQMEAVETAYLERIRKIALSMGTPR